MCIRDSYKLPEYARQNRATLAGHALTILRAFCLTPAAQRPRVSPLGSFEAWAQLVAGSLLWLEAADPIEAIADEREEGADPHQMAHATLLENWNRLEKHPRAILRWTSNGIAARAAIDALYPQGVAGVGDELDDLREALEVLAPPPPGRPPTVTKLGYALRHLRDRPANKQKLVGKPDRNSVTTWRVVPARVQGGCHKTPSTAETAGDAGDAGDDSSRSRSPTRSGTRSGTGARDGAHAQESPQDEGKDHPHHPHHPQNEPDPSVIPPPVSGVTSDPDEAPGYSQNPEDGLGIIEA